MDIQEEGIFAKDYFKIKHPHNSLASVHKREIMRTNVILVPSSQHFDLLKTMNAF